MIGFHISHEQFPPSRLLKLSIEAERAGFEEILSSDHFYPWSINQGQSGFAWSWLGAAMHATSLPFGVVSTPNYRYHPAILAQASATLSEMFPQRFWLCLGSGELLNEGIIGMRWPTKAERNQRLKESANIIHRLWRGETVTRQKLVRVEEAHLYTRPTESPMLLCSAMTKETAEWLGSWADGLLTVGPPNQVKSIIDAFRQGGGAEKPIFVKAEVSYAPKYEDALDNAWKQWKYPMLGSAVNTLLRTPAMFDEAAKSLHPEDITQQVCVSSKSEEHIQWLKKYLELGIKKIFVHNVNLEQKRFIDFYKTDIIPAIKKSS